MTPGLPQGRLAAIRRARTELAGPIALVPQALDATLALAGVPLSDLPPGTHLRIGADAVVEIGGAEPPASDGGLADVDERGTVIPARVVVAGSVRPGDPVAVETITLPLEDVLDLHAFRPDEVADVVAEYVGRARASGLGSVRIVHGRGRGVQRGIVRAILFRSPDVEAFADAPAEAGGWGATVVRLRAARA